MRAVAQRKSPNLRTSGRAPLPGPLSATRTPEHPLLQWQQVLGNRAVSRLVNARGFSAAAIQRQPAGGSASQPAVVDAGAVFVTNAKPTDVKFAARVGREDAQEIRSSGVLTPELRSVLNAKLRFFEGDAKRVYQEAIKAALVSSHGGVAGMSEMDQHLSELIQTFLSAAHDGINLFATQVLSSRLDELESGSWKTFLLGLLGNGMWAATVFLPADFALASFMVALTGIGIAAAPGAPSRTEDPLPKVQRQMYDYYDAYAAITKKAGLDASSLLIKSRPSAYVDDVIAELMPKLFRPRHYGVDTAGKIEIHSGTIREEVAAAASDRYSRFKTQVSPIGHQSYITSPPVMGDRFGGSTAMLNTHLAWVAIGNTSYLVRVQTRDVQAGFSHFGSTVFESFIDDDLKMSALEQDFQSSHKPVAVLAASEVRDFPSAIPAKAAKR